MLNKKRLIIAIIALVLLISLVIVFATKISKKNNKKENANNYSITFTYYVSDQVSQKISFVYKNKQLSDIRLIEYFDSKETAKEALKEYKANKEFKKYEVEKNTVVMYYKDSEVKDYKSYTKDDLIQLFTQMGYVYTKK